MPVYEVISDINAGEYPVGSTIELTEDEAAAIPWALGEKLGRKAAKAAAKAEADTAEEEPAAEKPKLLSVKDVVAQVLAIEDPVDREIAATDLLQAENDREDPPARTTLVSQLEEIIAQAQEDEGEGK